jgi:type I restriction enzyme, S subunit
MIKNKRLIPANWRWVKLGDICQTTSGGTPLRGTRDYYGGNIPWVKSGELNDGFIDSTEETLTELGLQNSSAKLFTAGTLLIALYGATVGRLGILNMDAATNQAVCAIFASDEIDRNFLFHYLLSKRDELIDISFGGAQPNISQEIIRSIEIPLPPLDEQRRIASRLNEQLAAVESARKAAEEQLQAAWQLQSAYFREMFLDITPLSASVHRDQAPKGWSWKKLTSIARLESGHTPSRYHAEWWGGTIPWLALPDIRLLDGKVAFETLEYTNELGIANSSARILPGGTVCLSRTASVGFVTILGREMATSQDFVNWVCGPEIDFYFLMYLFLASRDYFRSISSGAIHKTVYMPTAKALEVCVPSIDEQKRIVNHLKRKLSSSEVLVVSLESQLAEINRLPASLLREAFAGQG